MRTAPADRNRDAPRVALPRRLLLVKTGDAPPAVRIALGDHDRAFLRAIGAAARLSVVQVHLGERVPDARAFDGVVVTGSARSVTEDAEWMRRAGGDLAAAAARGVPVLGVCFGHQLLARALGGAVRRSPRGRELGTIRVSLTAAGRADPLFAGIPAGFAAQATHEDELAALPPGAEVLAWNAHAAVQAFRAGPCVAGVQFHPEMDAAAMAAVAAARLPASRLEAVRAGIGPTPHAARVLANFVAGL